MTKCKSCCFSMPDEARFCSACGSAVAFADSATLASEPMPVARAENEASSGHVAGAVTERQSPIRGRDLRVSDFSSDSRFLPGTLLSSRYRIVALLGRGGMGEVYRADDLLLSQPVALKFLPQAAANNESLLIRFRNEVRTARRVSHANVCRVYDLGEAEGQTFLSMEYVDGEDLSSLVRRIGRLPQDKAIDIARQLCAGLAAAHREGVLHRDLKPANIMLDGRGHAVITDFGLAGLIEQVQSPELRSGTPAYMAPEQLSGKEVTAKSEIYSLGLVLYELFTGKRAFAAETLAELMRIRNSEPLSDPSSWVKDLDPTVEKVIMRCLEDDPAKRPASALAVAALLPGGDPLAAALAAGETPSPELVAAAGEGEGIQTGLAIATLGTILAGLVIVSWVGFEVNGLRLIPHPFPPEAMTAKAQELVQNLGYSERPADYAGLWFYQTEITEYVRQHEGPRPDWRKILSQRPPLLVYGYRQAPVYLDPAGFEGMWLTPGVLHLDDPPLTQSGMMNLTLDAQGHLTYFEAIPNEFEPNPPPLTAPDWKPLFAAAKIDPSQLKPAKPEWVGLGGFDTRMAWTGSWPESGRPLRVEAAFWHGKPVFFRLTGPWTKPSRMPAAETTAGQQARQIPRVILAVVLLISGAWIARRNQRRGKSDSRGAIRLIGAVFLLEMLIWICRNHFIPTLATFRNFVLAISTGLFVSVTMGMLYLALEPYVRRHWPQAIVSWSRLITGRVRDSLIARDVLFGVTLGITWSLLVSVAKFSMARLGVTPDLPSQDLLLGGRQMVGLWLLNGVQSIVGTLQWFFVAFLFRVLLRNKWLAAAAFVAMFTILNLLGNPHSRIMVPVWFLVYSIAAYAVSRFGLITLAVAIFSATVLLNLPYTVDFTKWYATDVVLVLLSFVVIAGWAFYTSAGRNLFQKDFLQ